MRCSKCPIVPKVCQIPSRPSLMWGCSWPLDNPSQSYTFDFKIKNRTGLSAYSRAANDVTQWTAQTGSNQGGDYVVTSFTNRQEFVYSPCLPITISLGNDTMLCGTFNLPLSLKNTPPRLFLCMEQRRHDQHHKCYSKRYLLGNHRQCRLPRFRYDSGFRGFNFRNRKCGPRFGRVPRR